MNYKYYVIASLFSAIAFAEPTNTTIDIGLIADCQYADQAEKGQRLYRSCPQKLDNALNTLSKQQVDFVVHLGDYIDRDWQSFKPLDDVVNKHPLKIQHVLGNHEFWVSDDEKLKVPQHLGLSTRYSSQVIGDWRFIYLDGNDVSLYAWPKNSPQYLRSSKLYQAVFKDKKDWNGGIGKQQLNWLTSQLKDAKTANQKVALFCHFPIYPTNAHNLWNAEQVRLLLSQYDNVKVWFNGHQHNGDYAQKDGIHYLTLHAMLDTQNTSFARVLFKKDVIEIFGYGRQPSYQLGF
ncbi:metallophosphoesterase [Psychrobium sp. MM17-31]|uniref:metallophosphoesterase n=1 Tax=Psychrobium sp. MM17-31 TaxID=2917758 RepID=UPI001EF52875|nr:metallophosphoesterase [Psychrobium sp. MM17-31]MCG7530718.1 metallophosphoesterase [Psychrobium sp. MM17-31]